MRLALIRQRYTPYGGAERFIEGALEALLERNVAITLYTREWPQTNLHLIEPHICDPFYIGNLWRDWGFARAVGRAVGTTKANLVQSHERLLCCDIYRAGDGVHAVWLEERLRGASLLARLRVALNPWHRYTLGMERKLFASPWLRAVICNSKMVREEIKSRFGLPDARLPVIYNAVDSAAFHPDLRAHRERLRARYKIPADATVYLLVGTGYERKGVAAAIAAVAELPAPAHLLIVGRERKIGPYKRLAHALGVRERITFAGPQVDVKPFYGSADVFVLPTIYDPFPNAALEAMACGLPVVTTSKSGAAELVQEYDAGMVCASRDVAGLAAHMRALLDAETRSRKGANARRAIEPLTPSAMTLKLVLLYKEMLEASIKHKVLPRPPFAAPPPTTSATPTGPSAEAKPLHGEDGLANESLPAAPSMGGKPPLL
jgi:UDP-glucose:(heptosyl)LPS alpha-1,3-glucosyltransferase